MTPPAVGDEAPGFSLPGTGSRTYSLGDYRGQPVVLVFYPGDETPVCTQQLRTYSGDIGEFETLGATVLAISPQDVASHERFVAKRELAMPLLSDGDRSVGRAYGILGPVGFYRRSVFVVDPGGVVRYVHRAMAGLTFRPTTVLVRAVREIQEAAGAEGPGGGGGGGGLTS
ncbi:MAG: peroxiredoxin [Acidimicrobiales bacterium]